MITDLWGLTLALLAGALAGAFFFGGLWVTVKHLSRVKHPAPLIAASAILRSAFVLGIFFLLGRNQPSRLLACLAGFLIARFFVMRLTRVKASRKIDHAPES